jgi:hypothetical protein
MSTDAREERDGDVEPPEPKDHREPLTQRDVFRLYLRDLTLRPFAFAALGALAMIFLVMLAGGSDVGGVIVVLFGLATLVFRWVAGPPLLLLILFWFQLFPFGVPDFDLLYDNPLEVKQTYFRVVDAVLVMAVLVYFSCAYRLFGLLQRSMPDESLYRRKGERTARRPLEHVTPGEIAWLLGGAAALVILGQLVWRLANSVEFTPAEEGFPLRWADANSFSRYRRGERAAGEFTPGQNRFFVMVGGLFFGLMAARLVFGYWRMRIMGAAEAAMLLTDTSWSESHRERVRVEKWRIWGRERAKEQAKQAARAERERREKEAAERAKAEREARERQRRREEREARESRDRRRARRDRDEDDARPRRREWE